RFVNDPIGLRSKMGELDALISGSFAIQFFERVTWPSSDLDMYVKEGEGSDALCAYLVESEGYTLQATKATGDLPYAVRQFTHIWKYTGPIRGSEPEQVTEVHVIATSNNPINAILEGFYSTTVLNFITWNKAYALCPLTTFVQKRGYLLHDSDEYLASLVDKYTQRGWNIQPTMSPEDQKVNHSVNFHRRVGDRFTWKIPFDVRNVKCSKTPDAVLERVFFLFRQTSRGILSLSLQALEFEFPALHSDYTC
ncbi:MAG: hypothetical protein Q9180_009968, partial [Flavoplaca navasiana]